MRLNGEQFSKPTFYIDSEDGMAAAVEDLLKSKRIGVDTEGNSLHAYVDLVCAIQISNLRANYIFDPIRLKDASALEPIFSNPKIEKIFHGADFDVGLLKRDHGFTFNSIFDTMLGAQYLNIEKIGMADLVEAYYDVHLEKKYTKCNWARRPLSIEHMVYLCQDTQYLIGLRNWLFEQLSEKGLLGEIKIDFQHLEKRPALEPAYSNQNMWDIKGSKGLDAQGLPILFELFKWRQRQAKRQNRPPFKVLNNSTLIELAGKRPKKKTEMLDVKGVTINVWKRYGQYLQGAIQKGESRPPEWTPPPKKRKNSNRRSIHWNDQNLVDALKKWRMEQAKKNGIHSLAVLPGHTLLDISRIKPLTTSSLAQIEGMEGVRTEKYGSKILEIIQEYSD